MLPAAMPRAAAQSQAAVVVIVSCFVVMLLIVFHFERMMSKIGYVFCEKNRGKLCFCIKMTFFSSLLSNFTPLWYNRIHWFNRIHIRMLNHLIIFLCYYYLKWFIIPPRYYLKTWFNEHLKSFKCVFYHDNSHKHFLMIFCFTEIYTRLSIYSSRL